jgi:hypothetical protein
MMAHYVNMITFLNHNKITDWMLYFYCLFDAAKWGYVWNIKHCYQPRCLDMYTDKKDKCALDIQDLLQKRIEVVKQSKGDAQSKWFTIYPIVEDRKQKLQDSNKEMICMANISELLGYHPLSETCTRCKLQSQCAERISMIFKKLSNSDLDISKIRDRMISVEKAIARLKELGSSFNFYEG